MIIHPVFGEVRGFYTGIGSRKAPADIIQLKIAVAKRLSELGWVVRHGYAEGSDEAYEIGSGGRSEIFLPWASKDKHGIVINDGPLARKAEEIVSAPDVYPAWNSLKEELERLKAASATLRGAALKDNRQAAKRIEATLKLQRRNPFQVLGPDLATPSKFVLSWTPDGAIDFSGYRMGRTGGTGTAINLAAKHGIPVFNLMRPEHRLRIEKWLGVEPTPFELAP